MAYEKQVWNNGDVITEDKLNHIEDGIATMLGDTIVVTCKFISNSMFSGITEQSKTYSELCELFNDNKNILFRVDDTYNNEVILLQLAYATYDSNDNPVFVAFSISRNGEQPTSQLKIDGISGDPGTWLLSIIREDLICPFTANYSGSTPTYICDCSYNKLINAMNKGQPVKVEFSGRTSFNYNEPPIESATSYMSSTSGMLCFIIDLSYGRIKYSCSSDGEWKAETIQSYDSASSN